MRKRTLESVIGSAIRRALAGMQDPEDRPIHRFRAGEINGWTGENLASYVVPKVIRSVHRHMANSGKPSRRTRSAR